MMTERTKKLRTSKNIFGSITGLLTAGTPTFFVVKLLSILSFDGTLAASLGTIIYPLSVTVFITIILLTVVGFKVRNTLWMSSLLLASYLYDTTGMWIVFGIWTITEYVFYTIYKHLKNKYIINKEIDKR